MKPSAVLPLTGQHPRLLLCTLTMRMLSMALGWAILATHSHSTFFERSMGSVSHTTLLFAWCRFHLLTMSLLTSFPVNSLTASGTPSLAPTHSCCSPSQHVLTAWPAPSHLCTQLGAVFISGHPALEWLGGQHSKLCWQYCHHLQNLLHLPFQLQCCLPVSLWTAAP